MFIESEKGKNRTHPSTGRIESLEIIDISARNGKLELPILVEDALEPVD